MLYPIAISVGGNGGKFGVVFPDIEGCFSAGDTYEDALTNAKDALAFHLEVSTGNGCLPPIPSKVIDHLYNQAYSGCLWGLIDIDVHLYMGKQTSIDIVLPNLIIKKIDDMVEARQQYKSRAHFLQVAASNELNSIQNK